MSRNFATRYCSWCGRSIAVRKASALVRLWRPSTWIPNGGLQVNAETLRQWMLAAGLWSRARKRGQHRRRRERKEHFGELVQMDGSFHPWLQGRGPKGCLMDMADDATNKTLARLGEEETNPGRGGYVTRVDRALWSAAGVVCGLEKSVQAASDSEGTAARRRAEHAIRTHVREVRDRDLSLRIRPKRRAESKESMGPIGIGW